MTRDSEQWRAICEARGWLRRGYTTAKKIDELREYLAPKRSQSAISALIEDMRREYRHLELSTDERFALGVLKGVDNVTGRG